MPHSHLVLAPLAGWGHIRAEVNLALSLLEQDPDLIITLLPDRRCARRIAQELSTHPSAAKAVEDRLRVRRIQDEAVEGDLGDDQDAIEKEWIEGWGAALEELLGGKEAPVPGAIVVDLMRARFVLQKTRERLGKTGEKVKVMAMIPSLGAFFAAVKHAADAQHEPGLDRFDSLVRFPGLPPTYTFERLPIGGVAKHMKALYAPAAPSVPVPAATDEELQGEVTGSHQFTGGIAMGVGFLDALLTMIDPALEPELFRDVQTYFKSGIPGAGGGNVPILGLGFWQRDKEVEGEVPGKVNNDMYPTDDGRVGRFLDAALQAKGKGSVAYLSLGTFVWPAANPELFHWLLEGLLGTGLDVVVSLAPTRPTIFDKTAELLKDKRVVVVSWAPQNVILRHAATAFFVSHAGASACVESISAEIPVVTVPLAIDQPSGAAILERHGMALRLWQLEPALHGRTLANDIKVDFSEESVKGEMRKVFGDVKGSKGKEMRENAGKVNRLVRESAASGEAKAERQRLLAWVRPRS